MAAKRYGVDFDEVDVVPTSDFAFAAYDPADPDNPKLVPVEKLPTGGSYDPASSDLAPITSQVKLAILIDMVNDFGADPTGATACEAAFARMITYINAFGSMSAAAGVAFSIFMPDGIYKLLVGNLPAITVANVVIYHNGGAWMQIKDNPVFTLGSATAFQDTFRLVCQTITDPAVVPNAAATLVKGVQHARCFIDVTAQKMPKVYQAAPAADKFIGNIEIDLRGTGMVDRHCIDVDLGAYPPELSSAGVLVRFHDVYAKNVTGAAMPVNPPILPAVVTGISAANPPVVTTAADHNYLSGDRVSFRLANTASGAHPVNGALPTAGETMGDDDFLITVTGAKTFTLQTLAGANVNGTGWAAYTSGGLVTKRHFSFPHQKAAIRIRGRMDTVRITGVVQHWAQVLELELVNGSTSFVDLFDLYADYIGCSLMLVRMSGGSLFDLRLSDGWTFSLDHDWIRYIYSGTTGGTINGLCVNNWRIGMLGGVPLNDIYGVTRAATIETLELRSCVRSRGGNPFALTFAGTTSDPTIRGLKMIDPDSYWGTGNRQMLLPYAAVVIPSATNDCEITNCFVDVRSGGQFFAVGVGGNKVLAGNRCHGGVIPEHMRRTAVTVTTGSFTWTNATGNAVRVRISGGTVSAITIGNAGGNDTIATTTGQLFQLARGESVTIASTVAPTFTYTMLDG